MTENSSSFCSANSLLLVLMSRNVPTSLIEAQSTCGTNCHVDLFLKQLVRSQNSVNIFTLNFTIEPGSFQLLTFSMTEALSERRNI